MNNACGNKMFFVWLAVLVSNVPVTALSPPLPREKCQHTLQNRQKRFSALTLRASDLPEEVSIRFARLNTTASTSSIGEGNGDSDNDKGIASSTSTLNERLMAELEEAAYKENYGARSSVGRKMGLVDGFGRPRKTDEEIKEAIAKARDLNGVNPVVAVTGSLFALGTAAGLWYATNQLGVFYAMHPVDTDVYFVVRVTQVFRNVTIGLISLASGFFGVTGLGIFMLGIRVSYGVMTGELDPTPIKQKESEKLEMPNVWDLMMNKKPNRRSGNNDDDKKNPFGL